MGKMLLSMRWICVLTACSSIAAAWVGFGKPSTTVESAPLPWVDLWLAASIVGFITFLLLIVRRHLNAQSLRSVSDRDASQQPAATEPSRHAKTQGKQQDVVQDADSQPRPQQAQTASARTTSTNQFEKAMSRS